MKWIKVTERLPESLQEVIAYGKDESDDYVVQQACGETWLYDVSCCGQSHLKDVTHWMPIPPSPQGTD